MPIEHGSNGGFDICGEIPDDLGIRGGTDTFGSKVVYVTDHREGQDVRHLEVRPRTEDGRKYYSMRAAEDTLSRQANKTHAESPRFFRRLVERNWRAQSEPGSTRGVEPQDHHMGT